MCLEYFFSVFTQILYQFIEKYKSTTISLSGATHPHNNKKKKNKKQLKVITLLDQMPTKNMLTITLQINNKQSYPPHSSYCGEVTAIRLTFLYFKLKYNSFNIVPKPKELPPVCKKPTTTCGNFLTYIGLSHLKDRTIQNSQVECITLFLMKNLLEKAHV